MRKSKQLFGAIIILLGITVFVPQFTTDSKAAGELRVGWNADEMVRSLACNDAWQYEDMGVLWWQIVYDQAWAFDNPPDYKYSPRAITGYETQDNQMFRFFVREGMTWHDGKPVTAKDLAFTYEYLPVSNPIWAFYDAVTEKDSVTVIDDHTLQFKLAKPIAPKYPPFNWFPILPEHLWRRHKFDIEKYSNKAAIGSGPFKLKEYQSGQYMIFERFEDYWEKNPRVDKIVFKTYGSSDARNMALKKDEIDMMGYGGISPLTKKFLEKDSNISVVKTDGIALNWITFNLYDQEKAISDLVFRKAFVHAIDKERIIKMVYHGFAKTQDTFIYPELYEYNPNVAKYDYNPELANKMLDEKGYVDTDGDGIRNEITGKKNNMTYKFLVPSSTAELVKMAQLIREQMKAVNVDIRVLVTDLDTYYDTYYYPAGMGFDIAVSTEEPGPYASWIWEFMRNPEAGGVAWNTAYYINPDFDVILDKYVSVTDLEERKKLCFQLQEIMNRDLPHYVICRPDTIEAVRNDKLDGFVSYMGGYSTWINPFSYFNVHAK
ncbi:MAG: peptide ABC transporter substrate-binding protein [Desulfobacterales bacterium]|nr:peptide ABC transporter substrate-binding protein [Desulfobacterales bacterium]